VNLIQETHLTGCRLIIIAEMYTIILKKMKATYYSLLDGTKPYANIKIKNKDK